MKSLLLAALLVITGAAFAHDLDAICAENEHVDDELDEVGFCSLSLEAQRRQLNKMMVTTRRLNNANRYYFDPRETGSREHIQLRRPGMEGWTFAQAKFRVRWPFERGENKRVFISVDDGISWRGTIWIGRHSHLPQLGDRPRISHAWTVKVTFDAFRGRVMRWSRDRIGPPRWTTGGYGDARMTIPEAIAVVEGLLDCMAQGVEVAAFPEQCPL